MKYLIVIRTGLILLLISAATMLHAQNNAQHVTTYFDISDRNHLSPAAAKWIREHHLKSVIKTDSTRYKPRIQKWIYSYSGDTLIETTYERGELYAVHKFDKNNILRADRSFSPVIHLMFYDSLGRMIEARKDEESPVNTAYKFEDDGHTITTTMLTLPWHNKIEYYGRDHKIDSDIVFDKKEIFEHEYYYYDQKGRLILSKTVNTAYDAIDSMIYDRDGYGVIKKYYHQYHDSEPEDWEARFDSMGNEVFSTYCKSTVPRTYDTTITHFEYDIRGRTIKEVRPKYTVTNEWLDDNRLTSTTYVETNGEVEKVRLTYEF